MSVLEHFAGYRIDEKISASLFKAYDEILNRAICIKKFASGDKEQDKEQNKKRLVAFASSLCERPIEGFARIYQAGVEEGELFLISEYIEDTTPITEIASIDPIEAATQIAGHLRALHSREIAYLGLRPSNLLVKQDGSIVLSAFGFAQVRDPLGHLKAKIADDLAPNLDAYAFLAPEQKRGEKAGPGADWYALGILLYFLKTGELPEVGARLEGPEQAIFERLTHPDPSLRVFEGPGVRVTPRAPVRGADVKHAHIEPIPSEMAQIPAGRYVRGSKWGPRDEMPQHHIELSAFAIDIHPVTNEQFLRFLEAVGDIRSETNNDFIRLKDSRISRSQGGFFIEAGYAKHPVVGVTWYGARAYAAWCGKRLPTEAQWEIAAGHATFPTGEGVDKKLANFFNSDTTAVMSYPPGANGLYDMAGNVYEWCEDWYDFHAYDLAVGESRDPSGPLQGVYRSLRGGCWKSLENDLRRTHRHRNNPGAFEATYGFRCVSPASSVAP